MPQISDIADVIYLCGNAESADKMKTVPALPAFSERITEFLNSLSSKLIKSGRTYPDVVSFGFWCRKASVLKMSEAYSDGALRFGKGIAFHIAPSNVAVNFAYSLASGLLAGCKNIVRIPSKPFPQTEIIINEINVLIKTEYEDLSDYICLVRYPADSDATEAFSAVCDERIIWGGDRTVANIRKSPLKPRAGEITFADRSSFAVIDADSYISLTDKENTTRQFWNDTFLTDQNACTSPFLIAWYGKEIEKAKEAFWQSVGNTVQKQYIITGAQAVGKLHAAYRAAAAFEGAKITFTEGNAVIRVSIPEISERLREYKYNSGFFFETEISSFDELLPLCSEECQTVTYLGTPTEELAEWLKSSAPAGVDRVVPMGSSMDFSLIWDGYDLIREMSRIKLVI